MLPIANSTLRAAVNFTGPAPYNGQVSVLTGPNFSKIKPLITGLPVSGRDHAINGMTFDDAGNLLIAVGSATNAGVPSLPMGTLPNSPLDAAILKAPIFKADFNGAITYVETATGKPNNDQVYGDRVDVASAWTCPSSLQVCVIRSTLSGLLAVNFTEPTMG